MKNLNPLTLSILSGLLLFSAWPVSPLTPIIFIAWVPLLLIAEKGITKSAFFLCSYLSMFIWNLATTWWIWNASAGGAVGAIIANAFLMCIPLWGYHVFKIKFGSRVGDAALLVFWLSFEYIHLNWQLSWPWLTLGNVFATHPAWVQWYEYTGSSGGSFWIIAVNILLLRLFRLKNGKAVVNRTYVIVPLAVLALPVLISYLLYNRISSQPAGTPSSNVIIVQPNIDPYGEKFANGTVENQVKKLLSLSENSVDTNTRLIVWPETALPVAVLQSEVQNNVYCRPALDFAARHSRVTLLTGIETFKSYGTEKATRTARKNGDIYYDAFNAAIAIKEGEPFQFYNKSKLVPGVETLPGFLYWLGPIFESFGGTAGGYGHDDEARVFKTFRNPYVAAPIICYESIYGEYVADYVRKGATLLTVITNDGWWFDTPGHRQHLQYARLRAIETRRWVARSANTGISAVIDSRGDLMETRPWNKTGVIKYSIPALTGETFFVQHGDILSIPALFTAAIFIIWNLALVLMKRMRH